MAAADAADRPRRLVEREIYSSLVLGSRAMPVFGSRMMSVSGASSVFGSRDASSPISSIVFGSRGSAIVFLLLVGNGGLL